jgi:molybdopterin/thiamine biosynthesis adenylyltransferase/proteasome lid subunit RPN8/RPN11
MRKVAITDYALRRIVQTVGNHEPEQGGLLVGFAYSDVIVDFLYDEAAETSNVVYHNSAAILQELRQLEAASDGRFKGVLHSHPGGMNHPSSQDEREFLTTLRDNDYLDTYLSPIVTFDKHSSLLENEVRLESNVRISFFGSRPNSGRLSLFGMAPEILPICESIESAGLFLKSKPAVVRLEQNEFVGCDVTDADGSQLTLLFPSNFPSVPPIVLESDDSRSKAFSWNLATDPALRLRESLAGVSDPMMARASGLVSKKLKKKKIAVVGLGSVGSYVAEILVRSGVGSLVLIDDDIVSDHNLGRSNFEHSDIGDFKVSALRKRCRSISPGIELLPYAERFEGLSVEQKRELLGSVDLLFALTDDNATQAGLNHWTHHMEVPTVFIGLYKKAAGGEVIITGPGLPCWRCCTGGARPVGVATETDYGTGRLVAEPGLVPDIHFVSSVGARIGLSLLTALDGTEDAQRILEPLSRNQTYIAMSTTPDYWIFTEALDGAVGQHCFQSVWMKTNADPDCPVCGDNPNDPTSIVQPTATREVLLELYKNLSTQSEPVSEG